jgi:hypothetical protein
MMSRVGVAIATIRKANKTEEMRNATAKPFSTPTSVTAQPKMLKSAFPWSFRKTIHSTQERTPA